MTDPHVPTPAEDEPKTPMWLPALGAALFVGVALVWAVTPSSPPIQPEPAASASASASAAQSAVPPPPPPTAVASARPPPMPSGSAQQMNDKLRQLLDQMRQQGQGPGQPGTKR
jgi:hypothetical protein